MKVFCCLLASQRCKVVPAFMHFSAFVFSMQKWNDIGVCCSFCEKRIKDCDLFCCLFKRSECRLQLSHFVLFVKQKATKNEIQFFPLNQQVKKSTKYCLFQAGKILLQLSQSSPINKKKKTQTFIYHFFLPKQQHLSRMIERQFDPQIQCWFFSYKFLSTNITPDTWVDQRTACVALVSVPRQPLCTWRLLRHSHCVLREH